MTTLPRPRVFISHSSRDIGLCESLVQALRSAGTDVWYDQHNLGAGQLLDSLQREVHDRSIFIVVLSKAAFSSPHVRRECSWAVALEDQQPHRVLLPITAQPIEPGDFDANWLFLAPYTRIEAPGYQPYPQKEAIERTLRELGLSPSESSEECEPPPLGATAEDLVAEGKALYNRRQYACSALYCETATRLKPGYFSAWYNLAYALYDVQRFADGLTACERALALRPQNAYTWNLKGYLLAGMERYEDALAATQQAVTLNASARNWANHGLILNRLGRYDEALAAFENSLALQPKNYDALSGSIDALAHLGQHEQALMACDHLLELNPHDGLGWQDKGKALYELGRHADALAALNQALALAQNLAESWACRAIVLRALGRESEARESSRRAVELGGETPFTILRGVHTRVE